MTVVGRPFSGWVEGSISVAYRNTLKTRAILGNLPPTHLLKVTPCAVRTKQIPREIRMSQEALLLCYAVRTAWPWAV